MRAFIIIDTNSLIRIRIREQNKFRSITSRIKSYMHLYKGARIKQNDVIKVGMQIIKRMCVGEMLKYRKK